MWPTGVTCTERAAASAMAAGARYIVTWCLGPSAGGRQDAKLNESQQSSGLEWQMAMEEEMREESVEW